MRGTTFAVSAACFGWVGMMFLEQYLHQARAREAFAQAVAAAGQRSSDAGPAEAAPPATSEDAPPPPLARLRIARLDLDTMVEEGFDPGTLRKAVGHAPSSARPGERGNVVLAAHRDTFFSPLRYVRQGDEIELDSRNGRQHRYLVRRILVVQPTESWVMRSTPGKDLLTLITCYPFQYTGSAPSRLVVQAEPVAPARPPQNLPVDPSTSRMALRRAAY